MENLKFLGWDDFYEKYLTSNDKEKYEIARIISEHKNAFIIKTANCECRATISGHFFHNIETRSDIPVVGDWVLVQRGFQDSAIIQKIIPRKTKLNRRSPVDRKALSGGNFEQVIASNIDIVFIITSLNQNFNLSRIERALALVYTSGAVPAILLSKSDLCEDFGIKTQQVEQIAFGVPVINFSNVTARGLDEIQKLIEPGKTACMLGSSGVGKTSLMNILCNRSEKTVEIREKDAHGRHATTARSLYFLENGGMIIDTPGIREIGLFDSDNESLGNTYQDIELLALLCKFRDCTHTNEPGCAVLEAIKTGDLDERRLKNYLKLQKENIFVSDKVQALREKETKFKKIAKMIKQIK